MYTKEGLSFVYIEITTKQRITEALKLRDRVED